MHVSCDVDPFYCSPLRKRRGKPKPPKLFRQSDKSAAGTKSCLDNLSDSRETLVMCYFIFYYFLKSTEQCEPEIEDWNVPVKPEAMETLCQKSMFSRRELQRMYRSFKQVRGSKKRIFFCWSYNFLFSCHEKLTTISTCYCLFSLLSLFRTVHRE